MSTATTFDAPLTPRASDPGRDHRPGLVQLTRVELRKMYDTRAGFWLLLSGLLLALTTAVITILTGEDSSHTLADVFNNGSQAMSVLLPVVGILLVTSEWSQRTALLTFTMVPQRGRVLAAKVAASIVLAVAATAVVLLAAVLVTAINPSSTDAWHLELALVGQTLVFSIISMLIGVALGAAILLSAPAIVASFVLPIAWTAVTHLIGALDGLGNWTDQGETLGDMTSHTLSAHQWAQVGTTVLLWLVLPLAIGAWRFLRGEIR
jgi:ABC-2 type transport system permease protein